MLFYFVPSFACLLRFLHTVIKCERSYWDTAGGGVLWDAEGEPVLDDVRSPYHGSYHCLNE